MVFVVLWSSPFSAATLMLSYAPARFENEESSLSLLHYNPERFLLISQSEEVRKRVLWDGQSIITPHL
jgi:hypothetical protein